MWNKGSKTNHLELIRRNFQEPAERAQIIDPIKRHSLSGSEVLIAHMFSAADELFFDLSSRASSDAEQRLYFDAMREIRVKHEQFTKAFLSGLSQLFAGIEEPPPQDETAYSSPAVTHQERPTEGLSLVDGDDLEIELTKNNMTGRARDLFKEELYELNVRLDHLLPCPVTEENNPLDPGQLSLLFVDTCRSVFIADMKAQLILYKLFERHVLCQLGHIYADANQVLLEAGILPQIPKPYGNSTPVDDGGAPNMRQEKPAAPASTEGTPDFDDSGFRLSSEAFMALLCTVRELAQRSSTDRVNWFIFSANPGPVMSPPELTAALTASQHQYEAELARQGEPRNVVGEAINRLLTRSNPEQPHSLKEDDDNIINLVALFFDRILEDNNLPHSLQALLCRLQIPVLKAAIQNHRFFIDPQHPARRLINRMTQAGQGFDDGKAVVKDPLYRIMSDIVQTLNKQYRTDERVFVEMDRLLEETVQKENRKSAVVEQRTTQTEAGKSRIKQARSTAQAVMYQKLKQIDLPETVRDFLTTYWLQVMVITHLKFGQESSEWAANEQVITDLIWICNRHEDPRSQQRRERLMPDLLEQMEQGLTAAVDDPEIRAARVSRIEQTILAIHSTDINASETFGPLSEEQKEALGKGGDAPKSWQEMTAVERQQTHYEELASRFYEQALKMPEGAWIAYFDDTHDKIIRCKLTAKTDPEAYIFVNRFGLKVLEKTRKQFAYDLQFEKAIILDTRPLFDRIMHNVLGTLQPDNAG